MSGHRQPGDGMSVVGEIMKPAFVYFVQAGDDGPIKIGAADDPRRRVATLQTGQATELRMRAVTWNVRQKPPTTTLERGLHAEFDEDRIRGEWFRPTARLLRRIEFFNRNDPTWLVAADESLEDRALAAGFFAARRFAAEQCGVTA